MLLHGTSASLHEASTKTQKVHYTVVFKNNLGLHDKCIGSAVEYKHFLSSIVQMLPQGRETGDGGGGLWGHAPYTHTFLLIKIYCGIRFRLKY